jgi:solute carrier family 35 protein F5
MDNYSGMFRTPLLFVFCLTEPNITQSNAFASFISDIAWAYAMLLTTPLVVTVGLSMTIPLSLVGQMVLQSEYASPLYWVGAAIVFLSFLVVNHESKIQDEVANTGGAGRSFSGEYNSIPVEEEEMR